MIKVKNLVKTYYLDEKKIMALKNINLHVEKNDIFGVIGLSGAGKSSLVRTISSIEQPTSGEIYINNILLDTNNKKEIQQIRKKIGMIFQHFNLLMNRTVYENVAFPLEIHKKTLKDPKDINKKVNEMLEIVGITDKKNAFPDTLSGGQKQRVAIARALVTNPDILICDEATSALDPVTTKSVLALLKQINEKLGITILIITHEMDVIKEICTKVAILENGEVIEQGDVISTFVSPKTTTAKTFFEDANMHLSNDIYQKILKEDNVILKVNFIGDNSIEPFISYAIRLFDVTIAILAGNIQEVTSTIIGTLIVQINGTPDNIAKTMQYFADQKLIVEVIKKQ